MDRASEPERRTMPMPPRPGGVEMATMVSGCASAGMKTSVSQGLGLPGIPPHWTFGLKS